MQKMSLTAAMPEKTAEASCARADLSLQVARSAAEIEALRETWERWQEHPDAEIDNYLACCEAEGATTRPHVLVLYREGRPDCLLIGKRLERAATSAVTRLLPRASVLYFVQGGLVGNTSADNCAFLIREVIGQMRRGEADVAEFCGLATDSPLYRAAQRVPNFLFRDHFARKIVHRYLKLPASFAEFLGSLPAKERENIQYRQRRMVKKFAGKVGIRRFGEEKDVDSLIADAEEVAQKAYQRAFGRGFSAAAAAGLRADARKGSLRAYVLYIEDKPCAFLAASWHKGVLYGSFAGYDPKFSEYSPGRLLLMRCIEDCFPENGREKADVVDPGVGDQPYKRLFTNMEREEAHVSIHAPTLVGALRNLATTTLFVAAQGLKTTLVKADLARMRGVRRSRAVSKRKEGRSPSAGAEPRGGRRP